MTEIDKLIEEASNEHKDETDYIASQDYICGCSNENDKLFCWEASTACSIQTRESFKAGANFILHQTRWRKVEEELPEVLTDVLIKDSFGKIDIGCLYDNRIWGMTPPVDRKITEWKPIE